MSKVKLVKEDFVIIVNYGSPNQRQLMKLPKLKKQKHEVLRKKGIDSFASTEESIFGNLVSDKAKFI